MLPDLRRRRLRCRGWRFRRRCILGLGFGECVQGFDQFVRRGRRLFPVANFFEHGVNVVQRLQNHVHQFRSDLALVIPENIEHVLCRVAAVNQCLQLKEACAPFHGMEATENGVQQIAVIGMLLQIHQLLRQLFEYLAGFYQEVLQDLFISI